MHIRLVKEETAPNSLRPQDTDVWEGDVIQEESNPPIGTVVRDNKVYQFAFKLSGTFIYREVPSIWVSA